MGCSPWGCKESDTTEQIHFDFSLSCIGEGDGNPLQCSCLENPRDGRAWWAAVCGVPQSWTRLKQLSSSSSRHMWLLLGQCNFSVQSLSHKQLFATPWTAACQSSLSITNSQTLLKLYVHRVGDAIQPFHPLSFPSPPTLNLSQHQGLFQ